jgi:hypothetical protein
MPRHLDPIFNITLGLLGSHPNFLDLFVNFFVTENETPVNYIGKNENLTICFKIKIFRRERVYKSKCQQVKK